MKSERELLNELTWQMDFLIRHLFPEKEDEYDDILTELIEDAEKQRGDNLDGKE